MPCDWLLNALCFYGAVGNVHVLIPNDEILGNVSQTERYKKKMNDFMIFRGLFLIYNEMQKNLPVKYSSMFDLLPVCS